MLTAPPSVLDALSVTFPVGAPFPVPVTVPVQVVSRPTRTIPGSQTTDVTLETTPSGPGDSLNPAP